METTRSRSRHLNHRHRHPLNHLSARFFASDPCCAMKLNGAASWQALPGEADCFQRQARSASLPEPAVHCFIEFVLFSSTIGSVPRCIRRHGLGHQRRSNARSRPPGGLNWRSWRPSRVGNGRPVRRSSTNGRASPHTRWQRPSTGNALAHSDRPRSSLAGYTPTPTASPPGRPGRCGQSCRGLARGRPDRQPAHHRRDPVGASPGLLPAHERRRRRARDSPARRRHRPCRSAVPRCTDIVTFDNATSTST
ncbi:hypothetical protein ACRB68_23800 [Actinomadura sp. RB68]|uniref:Uncharacterized protein n=1 Tax=Actinomadura macrotermitis TaxID=2585200 RepID=A0A7K0BT51_9ACTN|nr:hypothetical protein [Actinomadura macrotermitis]